MYSKINTVPAGSSSKIRNENGFSQLKHFVFLLRRSEFQSWRVSHTFAKLIKVSVSCSVYHIGNVLSDCNIPS